MARATTTSDGPLAHAQVRLPKARCDAVSKLGIELTGTYAVAMGKSGLGRGDSALASVRRIAEALPVGTKATAVVALCTAAFSYFAINSYEASYDARLAAEHARTEASSREKVASAAARASAEVAGLEARNRVAAARAPVVAMTATKRLTPKQRTQILQGIERLRAVLQERIAQGGQTEEACDARMRPQSNRIEAASRVVGDDWMTMKTRFSTRAPNLGWDVRESVDMCMGCTAPDDEEPVPHDCAEALIVLDDLARDVRAAL